MNTSQLGQATNNAALEQAMMAAARDYKKELKEKANQKTDADDVDIDDLLDDPELEKLHADHIAELKQEAERRAKKMKEGFGTYEEIQEKEFILISTQIPNVVCHFFHRDFRRCAIIDDHLERLSKKFVSTKFIKLCAPDAPFFVEKLKVRVLPCILMLRDGIATDRIVGFEELGGKDDFRPEVLEKRLLKSGVLKLKDIQESNAENQQRNLYENTKIRKGGFNNVSDDDDWD